jgi:hypothetical protein
MSVIYGNNTVFYGWLSTIGTNIEGLKLAGGEHIVISDVKLK